ncbi:hypothetical protein A4G20_08985 [Pasteurellaceae bacterium RH1A]|nr:hypothetical protein A4G20_08985 [Pasteurellaceae bacterium RH1A]
MQSSLDLYPIWPKSENLSELYAQLSELKTCLDGFRPLSAKQVENLNQAFDVEYTYESNRIEGNTLTKSETNLVINKGMTVKGKGLIEHLEAINHQEAIDYIRDMAGKNLPFNKYNLLALHSLILHGIDREGAGTYRQYDVRISGSDFEPPPNYLVNELMEGYFAFYQANQDLLHPVELAAEMHERLVTIHPFVDGNGRTARLVMNLILLQHGYPITILESENSKRLQYYDSLEAAQTGKDPQKAQFKRFIAENVKQWLFNYLLILSSNGQAKPQGRGDLFFEKIHALNTKET